MKRLTHSIRRLWSALTQLESIGPVRRGDWRVCYPDGDKSIWMLYGQALALRQRFGGTLEWRFDLNT